MHYLNAIPADWSRRRQVAARWFIEDIAGKARMITKPDELSVEVEIKDNGQIIVAADSAIYHSFGTCFIGPRGGIKFRSDRFDIY